jgi:pyridinium-3,5-bisthiocarboxylic acid mononucleotide nickel chelatase
MKTHHDQVVVIDASPSGVSGDKYLGALLDLGADLESLKKVARTVADNLSPTGKVDVKVRKVERGEIGAQHVTIESEKGPGKRKGIHVLRAAEKCVAKLGLSDWGSNFSLSTIKTLLQAESRVHGHSKNKVELHELGSADTLVDVLGVAILVESLGIPGATWWSSPVAVGGGTTRFSDRTYPNPPPAVAEILRQHKFPMERGSANVELSTPTGVAITVNLVPKYSESYPSFKLERVGYGAGSKELDDVANVLRLTVGQSLSSSHSHDEIVILETNLDDVSGEVIGRAMETLFASGARDVTVAPVYMKKNRPGHIISVISAKDKAETLAEVLMAETGTFGVRELPVIRHISPRKTTVINMKVQGKAHRIRVKLSEDREGRIVGGKLEYEDLKRISDQTGLSVKDVQNMARPALEQVRKEAG